MRRLVLPALLLALAAPRPAAAVSGYLHIAALRSALDGSVRTEGSPFEADLEDDVGFEKEVLFDGRAGFLFGSRHRLGVGGGLFDHEVDRSLGTFDFEGQSFAAEASVKNRLRWVELDYAFAPLSNDKARLELLLGARLYRYEGEVTGRVLGESLREPLERTLSTEATGPVPHVGATLELRLVPMLVLRGSGKYFKGGVDDDKGHELDVEGSAGLRLGPMFELGAGYRRFDVFVSADDGRTEFDFRYRGFFAYLRVSP